MSSNREIVKRAAISTENMSSGILNAEQSKLFIKQTFAAPAPMALFISIRDHSWARLGDISQRSFPLLYLLGSWSRVL